MKQMARWYERGRMYRCLVRRIEWLFVELRKLIAGGIILTNLNFCVGNVDLEGWAGERGGVERVVRIDI